MPNPNVYRLLFGPYHPPRCRLDRILKCEVRGEVIVCGMTDGRIPWPIGKRVAARSLVVCGGLARAVRRESGVAVCYWWGVTPQTVTKWRKALGVGPVTAGTRRARQEQWRRVYTPELVARTVAAMNTPEANAKKSLAKLGKPRPPHVQEVLRRAQLGRKASPETRAKMSAIQKVLRLGRKHSPETRAKMSATHKARGTWPPAARRPQ